ncbi:MAG: rRNA pseudouridine synthase [Bacteroidetes bacterium]|nr:rRNA pseudouridine synthase [Bacteroidota bacterium]
MKTDDKELIRLNKFISNAGVCSRRKADDLILKGKISVNDKTIKTLGHKIKNSDIVKYNNKILNKENFKYILLNKPKDYITTLSDPQNRKTIMQLVKKATTERIYPIGRLDRNTTGLILLTNDGETAQKLAHPSKKIKKTYEVILDKPINDLDLNKIKKGVILKDGKAIIDHIQTLENDFKKILIEIHIGKNRIIRRIFESLGYEVNKLDRVLFGNLDKKHLPRGKWRFLTKKEIIETSKY